MYIRVKNEGPGRIVHAYNDKFEVVRYSKTRHWFIEPRDLRLPRQRVTLSEAIDFAKWLLRNRDVRICLSMEGGERFEAALTEVLEQMAQMAH